jgi:hypothetical protein
MKNQREKHDSNRECNNKYWGEKNIQQRDDHESKSKE